MPREAKVGMNFGIEYILLLKKNKIKIRVVWPMGVVSTGVLLETLNSAQM